MVHVLACHVVRGGSERGYEWLPTIDYAAFPKVFLAASLMFVLDSVDAERAPSHDTYGTVPLMSHMHCPFTLPSAHPSSPTRFRRHSVATRWRVAPDGPSSPVRTSRAATNLERAPRGGGVRRSTTSRDADGPCTSAGAGAPTLKLTLTLTLTLAVAAAAASATAFAPAATLPLAAVGAGSGNSCCGTGKLARNSWWRR